VRDGGAWPLAVAARLGYSSGLSRRSTGKLPRANGPARTGGTQPPSPPAPPAEPHVLPAVSADWRCSGCGAAAASSGLLQPPPGPALGTSCVAGSLPACSCWRGGAGGGGGAGRSGHAAAVAGVTPPRRAAPARASGAPPRGGRAAGAHCAAPRCAAPAAAAAARAAARRATHARGRRPCRDPPRHPPPRAGPGAPTFLIEGRFTGLGTTIFWLGAATVVGFFCGRVGEGRVAQPGSGGGLGGRGGRAGAGAGGRAGGAAGARAPPTALWGPHHAMPRPIEAAPAAPRSGRAPGGHPRRPRRRGGRLAVQLRCCSHTSSSHRLRWPSSQPQGAEARLITTPPFAQRPWGVGGLGACAGRGSMGGSARSKTKPRLRRRRGLKCARALAPAGRNFWAGGPRGRGPRPPRSGGRGAGRPPGAAGGAAGLQSEGRAGGGGSAGGAWS
jgi:hypothetical protein